MPPVQASVRIFLGNIAQIRNIGQQRIGIGHLAVIAEVDGILGNAIGAVIHPDVGNAGDLKRLLHLHGVAIGRACAHSGNGRAGLQAVVVIRYGAVKARNAHAVDG